MYMCVSKNNIIEWRIKGFSLSCRAPSKNENVHTTPVQSPESAHLVNTSVQRLYGVYTTFFTLSIKIEKITMCPECVRTASITCPSPYRVRTASKTRPLPGLIRSASVQCSNCVRYTLERLRSRMRPHGDREAVARL